MHLIILVKQLGLYHFLFVFKSSFKKKRKGKVGSCRSGTYFAPLLCGLNLLGKRAFNNYYSFKQWMKSLSKSTQFSKSLCYSCNKYKIIDAQNQ